MSELDDFLTQEAEIFSASEFNADGQQVFGIGRTVNCKFVNQVKRYRDANGEEIISDETKLYLPITDPVKNQDRVIYNGKKYEVMRVEEQVGTVTDLQHKKLILKLSQA